MNWPHASLTDQQARDTWFKAPDFSIPLALGAARSREFLKARQRFRENGGELLVIGWPDGTTITFEWPDCSEPLDVEGIVATYRASAALYRARTMGGKP